MSYKATVDVIEALQSRLASLRLEPENAGNQDKLFQRVAAYGANRLAAAMKAVFASEQRVCFIVPGGDKYSGVRDRNVLFSQRSTRLALLIADRAFDQDKNAALIGGPGALGILAMKDRVIADLTTNAFAGPDLAFEPAEGESLMIENSDKAAGNLGRECWLQWLGVYAGSARIAIP